ncbi:MULTISPECIES: hypothetical protein [Sphingobacterium]|uniref:Uncharacterized protein n=1 Tax=Sphingobacterium multivorum TaxID=28454 RepID=A0A653YBM0_SPHMU|nr:MULTISPECIES: hypothetical protein [Sphingobacterium]HAE66708.1 hypothetical protein [Sphingobacterium sp.]OFV12324.1 hypothetical protein HMPREF3127_16985 [Sphingobacterium sp. HMSC13C05]VXC39990.1 conserved hypothetical protein [Sphingobacterium multivorum]HAF33175.1 hypothetical protein [Sphingobacterium sp.]HAT93813.1 hypothetical protein [Sphingobacterium sp.]
MDLRRSKLLKMGYVALLAFLLYSCVSQKENKKLTWYQHQIIEQLVPETDSSYRVQIGIMAATFWLDNQDGQLTKKLNLLQQSYTQRNKVDVAVQQGTNKIIRVTKSE